MKSGVKTQGQAAASYPRLDGPAWGYCLIQVALTAHGIAILRHLGGIPDELPAGLLEEVQTARANLPLVLAIGLKEGWISEGDADLVRHSELWPHGDERVDLPGSTHPALRVGLEGRVTDHDWVALAGLHGVDPAAVEPLPDPRS